MVKYLFLLLSALGCTQHSGPEISNLSQSSPPSFPWTPIIKHWNMCHSFFSWVAMWPPNICWYQVWSSISRELFPCIYFLGSTVLQQSLSFPLHMKLLEVIMFYRNKNWYLHVTWLEIYNLKMYWNPNISRMGNYLYLFIHDSVLYSMVLDVPMYSVCIRW